MDSLLSVILSLPPSPTPHLLKKNEVPSTEDKDDIRDYLEQLDHFLEKSKHKRNLITRYNVQQAEKLAEVHRRLLQTSARELPTEIIQHIALCTVEDTAKLPWTLSWVCSAWRRAVVGYQQLWCTLPSIRLVDLASEISRSRGVDKLILRSGNLPLNIDISALHVDDTPTFPSPVLDLLLQQADRWVTARVNLRFNHLYAFARATARMHQLRHLTIAVQRPYPEGSETPPILDLSKFTALRSLRKMTQWPPTQLPEGTIESYTGKMHEADMLNHLFLLSPTLTTLMFTCNSFFRQPPGDSGRIRFPKLTELVFYEGHSIVSSSPFAWVVTPYLETVKVSRCSSLTFNTFIDMVACSNSSATLTTLHIYTDSLITYSSFVSLFTHTPNLVELKIAEHPTVIPVIRILSYLEVAPAGHLLPRLERLTILIHWEAKPSAFQSINSIGLLRMEEPPEQPLQPDFLHRLETFEVVLRSSGPTLPHEKQDRSRNIMEHHWRNDPERSVLQPLIELRERLYDVKLGNGNPDKVAQAATLLLGQLMTLDIPLIQEVYVCPISRPRLPQC